MSISLTYTVKTIRGDVTLSADLSTIEGYEVTLELDRFFDSVSRLESKAREMEREYKKLLESIQEKKQEEPIYHEMQTCSPVLVV